VAIEIPGKSALVRSAKTFIDQHISEIRDDKLRTATADAIDNSHTCIHHEVTGQTGKMPDTVMVAAEGSCGVRPNSVARMRRLLAEAARQTDPSSDRSIPGFWG